MMVATMGPCLMNPGFRGYDAAASNFHTTQRAYPKRYTVVNVGIFDGITKPAKPRSIPTQHTRMNPPQNEIKEEHNPETKQMDFVLTYDDGITPSQTIRLPMHEAIGIIMEWLSGYSQAYPMLLI